MNLNNLFRFSLQNLKRNKQRVFFSSIGVVIGIATLIFFFSLTDGARELIFEHFFKKLPSNQLRVHPRYEANIFGFGMQKLLGGDKNEDEKAEKEKKDDGRIGEDIVAKIKGIEGVSSVIGLRLVEPKVYVYPFLPPRQATISTKAGLAAYDNEYIAQDLENPQLWKWKPEDKAVPALISRQVILTWNEFLASTSELPRLDEKTIIRTNFYITVWNLDTGVDEEFKLKILGLSDKAPFGAPLVPLEFVQEMNRRSFGKGYTEKFSSLIVSMENPSYVSAIKAQFEKMGLEAGSNEKVAEMIEMGINVLAIFLTSISLIIVIISLVNVFNIFVINVMERKFEIGVMRAVGASRGDIRAIILTESAFIGFVNGIVGSVIGIIAILLVEPVFTPLLEKFVMGQANFFAINPWIVLGIIIASPLVNIIAVFQPANYAANLDPVVALRK